MLSRELSAPSKEAPAPSEEVPAPSGEVPAPRREVSLPSREVPVPSMKVSAPSREGYILLFLQFRSTNRRGAEDFPEVSCLQYVNLDKFSNTASGKL